LENYSNIRGNEILKRNNVYVGMTRAMDELQILTLSQQIDAQYIKEISGILEIWINFKSNNYLNLNIENF